MSNIEKNDEETAASGQARAFNIDDLLKEASHVKPEGVPRIYKKIGQWVGLGLVVVIVMGVVFFSTPSKKAVPTVVPTPQALNGMRAEETELQENIAKLNREMRIEPSMPVNNSAYPAATVGGNTQAEEHYLARENAPTRMYSANANWNTNKNASQSGNGVSQATFAGQGGYSHFGNQNTGYSTVSATRIAHPATTIASGEFIHAVLETAVNSDLPGMVRAVISEPVYAYVGERPLIPAGSRLIGQYSSAVMQGMTRVFVIWNRVILPNGTTVEINSPGTDNLGIAGMNADSVNTHFFARFGEASLLSVIGAGAANSGVSSNDAYNSEAAYREAVSQSFQRSAQQSLQGTVAMKPTLKVFQGTNIVVFVAHDLSFYTVLNPTGGNAHG